MQTYDTVTEKIQKYAYDKYLHRNQYTMTDK